MKPKDILLKAIDSYLVDGLEAEGFSFSKSQMSFNKRLSNGLVQKIVFTGNPRNYAAGMVRYGEHYRIVSNEYQKWWKENFPEIPVIGNGALKANRSAFIGVDQTLKMGSEYEFHQSDSKQIMDLIWANYMNHGRRFFEQNNTWEKLGARAQSPYTRIDALIFAGLIDEAFDLATEIKHRCLEQYPLEEKMNPSVKQIFEVVKSRLVYIENGLHKT